MLALLVAGLGLSISPAVAQKYYTAQIGTGNHAIHATYSYSDCNGPIYSANDFTASLGTLTMVQGLNLTLQSGAWIIASSSANGPTSYGAGQASFVSAVSAAGVITTWEFGYYNNTQNAETGSVTSVETVDLNTGRYTWNQKVNIATAGSCPGYGIATQSRTAYLPITMSTTGAPSRPSLGILNPFGSYISNLQIPSTIDPSVVTASSPAAGLVADGMSAVVVALQSSSSAPVSLTLTAPGLQSNASFGSLSSYNPSYLANPAPSGGTQVSLGSPAYCNATGTSCVFLALLWAPSNMPVSTADLNAGNFHAVNLSLSATQGSSITQTTLLLMPPPLVLVHDLWSSADQAFPTLSGFLPWISAEYPHNVISRVDYGASNSKAFNDPAIQNLLLATISNALASASSAGLVARQVDIVGHGMGGLVARSFLAQGPPVASPYLPANPVHNLVTIGTPHNGSALASLLTSNANATASSNLGLAMCNAFAVSNCTLSAALALQGQTMGAGLTSLGSGLPSSSGSYNTVAGQSPASSGTGSEWNAMLQSFVPGQSLTTVLGSGHDTFASVSSQTWGSAQAVTTTGLVHNALTRTDTGETFSPAVWSQALYWLMGGVSQTFNEPPVKTSTLAPPFLDLTGYSPVPASNVSFSPASGSALIANLPTTIAASSSSKTITEVLLFQNVTQPSDVPLLYSTQSPYSIVFVPNRLGSTTFGAIVLFSDKTYAVKTLQYALQPNGLPSDLQLVGAPATSVPVNSTVSIAVKAEFSNGPIDVTSSSSFAVRSGTQSVMTVSNSGVVSARGTGVDWLDVSYGGITKSTQISVGSCSFQISPASQMVPSSGGVVAFQVTTAAGCSWTANTTGSPWLVLNGGSGTGNGTVTVTAPHNTSGNTQVGFMTLGNQNVAIVQPASACNYAVSPLQITAPGSGATGSLAVNSACPTVVSSNASWVVPVGLGSSVEYSIAPNTDTQPRSASLTVGTQSVSVNEGQGCVYVLSQSAATASGSGLNGSFNVTTGTGCTWIASASAPWLLITGGSSGSGSGSVNYTVAANPNTTFRSGTVTVSAPSF